MHRGIHAELLHALDLRSIDLVDVRQLPAQPFDRMFFIDGFDLIEKRVDSVVQFGVYMQRQARGCDGRGDALPLSKLIGGRVRVHRKHGIVQRSVDAFAEEDVVNPVVALKELHLCDLRNDLVRLLRRSGGVAVYAEDAQREPALRFPLGEDVEHVLIAARNAEGGEAAGVHVLEQCGGGAFELIGRDAWHLARHHARARYVAGYNASRFAGSITLDRIRKEAGGIGLSRFYLQGGHSFAVEKNLIVRLLERDRVVGRERIEFVAHERAGIIRELMMRPPADVVDPLTRRRGFNAGTQFLDGLLARIDAVEADFLRPGRGRPQQVHVVIDEPGDYGPAVEIDAARRRACKRADLLRAADGNEAIAADSNRLGDAEAVIDSDDLAVQEDNVGSLGKKRDRGEENSKTRIDRKAAQHRLSILTEQRFQCATPLALLRFFRQNHGMVMRVFAAVAMAALLLVAAAGQSASPLESFEVADIHASPRVSSQTGLNMRTVLRGGRYEIRNATIVDLVRTAYTIDADKIVGGPNWVEFDRFDVIAKAASDTPLNTLRLRLQGLLADRFELVIHKDTRPVAGYALAMGKGKPKLKASTGKGASGCERKTGQLSVVNGQITIGSNSLSCHDTTMEAFAAQIRSMDSGYFTNAVVDSTGLKGSWDFDLKWQAKGNIPIAGPDAMTMVDAVDKQLGLRIEEHKIPTGVLVIDQVNRRPTDNPPDLDARLPSLPPAEFEVADIKPTVPGSRQDAAITLGFQPGGRVDLPGISMRLAATMAWNLNSNAAIPGAPKWFDTAQFDIVAKAPAAYVSANGGGGPDDLGPMMQALLKDRFKMKVHFEDQLVTAYTLIAAKPKLKKADPASRIGCKIGTGPIVSNAGLFPLASRMVTCRNITMAQFAEQLQALAGPTYIEYPVLDATGIGGAWDFSFTFSPVAATQLAGQRPPPAGAPGAGASDPGGGASLFEAIEKQVGLKLEAQKRPYPVFVIDHIEEKPTEN